VTQRGNRREDVFFVDTDYRRYLSLLGEYAGSRGLEILAYCLMPNHVHLVVVPANETSLAATLKPVHLRYAQHVNRTRNITGRVWQGRFFSCPMDARHTTAAVRYVEANPVRAKGVLKAETYKWSSAAAHVGLRDDHLLSDRIAEWVDTENWSAWLAGAGADSVLRELRLRTRTGRPLGDADFTARLEQLSGRRLHAWSRGRPRKRPAAGAENG